MTQPQGIQPGVYLDLDIDLYHSDPAISSSGIKTLLRSAEAYWHSSCLNPNRQAQEETPALKWGKAYHTLVFEPEKFDYAIKKGVQTSSVAKTLGEGQYNEMQAMRDRLMRYTLIPNAITGGFAEVSVFWRDEESGLMCRCRFDYWRPGYVVDLKTETAINKETQSDIRYDFPRYGYEVSGAMYMEGSRALKQMLRDGTCHIDERISLDFLERYVANETERFMFLFQEKTPPYEAQGRCISEQDDIGRCGYERFRRGLEIYRHYSEVFQTNPWVSLAPEIVDITIDNMSAAIHYN